MILALLLIADLLGTSQIRVDVSSSNAVTRAWRRSFVMQAPDGEIVNDDGVVATSADAAAIAEVAAESSQIADGAYVATTNALVYLTSHTNQMASASVSFALVMPPETDRETLTMYVVDESTDGTNDVQWVWFNHNIALSPNRYVVYEYMDMATTVKCDWGTWVMAGEPRTVNGVTWNGCHRCTVARPSWAVGVGCLTNPHDKLGGPAGLTTGDLVVKIGNNYGWTGYVTNDLVNPKIELYFDSGFLKSRQEISE